MSDLINFEENDAPPHLNANEAIFWAQGATSALGYAKVKCAQKDAEIGELQAKLAMQDEAFKELIWHTLECEKELDEFHGMGSDAGSGYSAKICDAQAAISATSEDVEAWKEKQLAPLRREVAMLRRAYWLARNSAAGLTNFCEESASARRCEKELEQAEELFREIGAQATAEAYEQKIRTEAKIEALEEFVERLRTCESRYPSTVEECAFSAEMMAAEFRNQTGETK